MSPRKAILRELSKQHQRGGGERYTRPSSIAGFATQPDRYQKAVNELLQARLVEGQKDGEGHMAIALNQHRLDDVLRELKPFWARPAIWAVIALVLVSAGVWGATLGS